MPHTIARVRRPPNESARSTRSAGQATPSRIIAAARRLEAEGRDIVRLDIGEPHLDTPAHIVAAAVRALHAGATRYVAPAGLPELREAIALDAGSRGIRTTAEQVVVTSGAKPMLLYALLALVGPGDEVLVPDPGYPGYASAARLAGARAVPYAITRDGKGSRFRIDLGDLQRAITPATRALVLNAPQNPTGCMLSEAELDVIAELALAHDLRVVSDEVYARLAFGAQPVPSIAQRPEMAARTIVVDSFSKTYAMTGWRLGYGVIPTSLVATVTSLVADSTTCAPAFVQEAGLAALCGPQGAVEHARAEYRLHCDLLHSAVNSMPGLSAPHPEGGFYLFMDVRALLGGSRLGHPSSSVCLTNEVQLADELLYEHGVACIPGSAYGARGEGQLRLSFAITRARLDEACRRLGDFAAAYCPID